MHDHLKHCDTLAVQTHGLWNNHTPLKGAEFAEFDLDGRRNAMDEAAMQVAEFQEETVLKRKELASNTRNFKGKVTSDVSKAVGPLLKAYQGEVDRLTRR